MNRWKHWHWLIVGVVVGGAVVAIIVFTLIAMNGTPDIATEAMNKQTLPLADIRSGNIPTKTRILQQETPETWYYYSTMKEFSIPGTGHGYHPRIIESKLRDEKHFILFQDARLSGLLISITATTDRHINYYIHNGTLTGRTLEEAKTSIKNGVDFAALWSSIAICWQEKIRKAGGPYPPDPIDIIKDNESFICVR